MIKFLDLQKITDSFQPELNAAVHRVIESGWYLHGRETQAFEDEFATFCNKQHCIGVGNGLDALSLTLSAWKSLYDWNDGDEVIVPAMTFVATAQAVVRAGLHPVLVDVTPNALIDPNLAEEAVTSRTRAVIPVHLYGQTADMAGILAMAERHHLMVLEDAAQAHGGRDVARFGHAAAFSFYPGKNLGALGDGGAVVTDNPVLATRVRTLANYGARVKYHHEYPGCNSRLDELQAAVLRVKLHRLTEDNERRRYIAARYQHELHHPLLRMLDTKTDLSVWHIFPVFVSENRPGGLGRDNLQERLTNSGIQTLIHYPIPLQHQPCLRLSGEYPMAAVISDAELSLPISPVMTDDEVSAVIDSCAKWSVDDKFIGNYSER